MKIFETLCLTLLFLNAPVMAESLFSEHPHSKARLIRSSNVLDPDQSTIIGLQILLDDGWYTYWENPGDSGAKPRFDFKLPDGVNISDALFPLPARLVHPPLVSFGYKKEVIYLFTLKTNKKFDSPIALSLSAEWLVCQEECIPAFGDFQLVLDPQSSENLLDERTLLEKTQQALPLDLEFIGGEVKAKMLSEQKWELNLTTPTALYWIPEDFFPAADAGLNLQMPKFHKEAAAISMQIESSPLANPSAPKGLFTFHDENGNRRGVYLNAQTVPSSEPGASLAKILLFAFIGGMILNLMPCVFPILSIKILGLMQESQGKLGQIRKSSLAYIFGVVISFIIIAFLLVALKKSGQALGWGFQLQSPYFVGFMFVLFIILGLSLFDLFHINLPISRQVSGLMHKKGPWGQFFTGVLSTVVASPCTAPFMGFAMGAAITQSTAVIFLTFATLGLGLSFPYILLMIHPGFLTILPKPGNWMNSFKKILAIPMFATALWLGWIFIQVSGLTTSILGEQNTGITWLKFDRDAVSSLIQEEKKIFVDFTADWCITCKVNERVTFQSVDVQDFIKKHNIVMMKADWTKRDDDITHALAEYDRIGVPLYLFWTPNQNKAHVLPEILTPGIFIRELSDKM